MNLPGVVSLLLTPFHHDGAIDWTSYEGYVDWQLSMKPAGLFAVCGSSEMHWLTLDERVILARRAVELANGTPVIATANLQPERAAHADEIARMADAGVSGVVLIPRSELALEPERHLEYFLELIDTSDVPVFLYEWPQVEHYLLPREITAGLAPHVSGIKDTTCTPEGIGDKIDVAGEMVVYQANTPFLPDAIGLGARGYMAITSTCFADLAIAAWEALQHGTDERALTLHRELVFLDNLLVRAYPATAKYLVKRRGVEIETVTRWPVRIEQEHIKALDVWMDCLPQDEFAGLRARGW